MIQLPSTYGTLHGQPTICLQEIFLAPRLCPRSLQQFMAGASDNDWALDCPGACLADLCEEVAELPTGWQRPRCDLNNRVQKAVNEQSI